MVASTFIEQANHILHEMVKEGKQSAPLDKIIFPHFSVFIGKLPNNCQIILPINIPEDLEDKIGKQPVYVVNCY